MKQLSKEELKTELKKKKVKIKDSIIENETIIIEDQPDLEQISLKSLKVKKETRLIIKNNPELKKINLNIYYDFNELIIENNEKLEKASINCRNISKVTINNNESLKKLKIKEVIDELIIKDNSKLQFITTKWLSGTKIVFENLPRVFALFYLNFKEIIVKNLKQLKHVQLTDVDYNWKRENNTQRIYLKNLPELKYLDVNWSGKLRTIDLINTPAITLIKTRGSNIKKEIINLKDFYRGLRSPDIFVNPEKHEYYLINKELVINEKGEVKRINDKIIEIIKEEIEQFLNHQTPDINLERIMRLDASILAIIRDETIKQARNYLKEKLSTDYTEEQVKRLQRALELNVELKEGLKIQL